MNQLITPKALHLLNKVGWKEPFTLLDHRIKTDYKFTCPHCGAAIVIDTEGAADFSFLKWEGGKEALEPFGGTAFFSKIIGCNGCQTHYFIGIEYLEPNHGRDVLILHNIVEVES
jgi:hypothetical protein